MKTDNTYNQLIQKMYEVGEIEPQTLGILTPLYKRIASFAKRSPLLLGVLAIFGSFALYFLLGSFVVRIVSKLQYGF